MIIADKEGQQAIGNLCHIALTAAGFRAYNQVKAVEEQTKPLKESGEEKSEDGK